MSQCPFSGATGATCPMGGNKKKEEKVEEETCPIIHAVNDDETPVQKEEENVEQNSGNSVTDALAQLMDDSDTKNDIPSVAEYKKLRRTTAIITGFYKKGTETKKEQYENVTESIGRLEGDENQCKIQIESLKKQEKFKNHLKFKEYLDNLEYELSNFATQKEKLLETQKHYYGLHVWSQEIVKICEWLEQHLDYYAYKTIQDLPVDKIFKGVIPTAPPELTDEEKVKYSKGLDEICHNLNESRDFFEAAVDGRLNKYQQIEREIILDQLETLKQFPIENNPRREYIESELRNDLEHVENQIEEAKKVETQKRREFMLKMHREFIDVLSFFRENLGVLNDSRIPKTYDPQFTSKFVLPNDEE
ncbi:hypothetical protein ABK040_010320 [Willaertia magna]